MNLENKNIFITGGSGLIGSATVTHLLSLGAKVWNLHGPDSGQRQTHPNLIQIPFDVTDTPSFDAFFASLRKENLAIDAWINNAYPRTEDWGAHFSDVPQASLEANVSDQMNSVFLLCQKVVAHMEAMDTKGSIVNLASVHGVVAPHFPIYDGLEPSTSPPAYSLIKGGIISFTRYLAALLGPKGIRVNAVSPGGVKNNQSDAFVASYSRRTPLGRMARAEEMAGPIAFLCSEESTYITGHNLVVDGGHSIW